MNDLRIVSFRGPYFFLSNFFPVEIIYEGIKYPSSEHAYQAAKTVNIAQRLEIARQPTAALAKRMGKTVTMRPNWSLIKLKEMEKILRIKFSQSSHPDLYRSLQRIKPYRLIEHNQHGDQFWGFSKGKGQNHLGKLLMKIRDET